MRVLLALLLAGCTHYPYVSIETGVRRVNGEPGFVACGEVGQEFGRNAVALSHCSNPGRGYPINERFDYSVDQLTYSRRFAGGAR